MPERPSVITLFLAALGLAIIGGVCPQGCLSTQAKPPQASSAQDKIDYYMKSLSEKIGKVWKAIELDKKSEAVITFTIGKQGEVESAELKQSSGDDAADKSALLAVRAAAPYAVPPTPSGKLTINYTFTFRAKQDKVDMQPYVRRLDEKIRRVWAPPKALKKSDVGVKFEIAKTGHVKNISVKKSSGEKPIDDAAVNAVKRAAPFDPLPEAAGDSFALVYTFNCGPGSTADDFRWNGMALPDVGYQVTRSGATLRKLDTDSKAERQLQERAFALEDRAAALTRSLMDARASYGERSEKLALILKQRGDCYSQLKDFGKAEGDYKLAVSILEEKNSPDADSKKDLSGCLASLAEMYVNQNKLADAEPLMAQALRLRSEYKETDVEQKPLLEQYAKLLYKLNHVAEAEKVYERLRR